MSFEYLKHFFGEAHILMFEIAVVVTAGVTLYRWIRRDIDDLKGPKKKG